MKFDKIVRISQPSEGFSEESLTVAQIEKIVTAAIIAPIRKDFQNEVHVSVLMDNDEGDWTKLRKGPVYFVISAKRDAVSNATTHYCAGMMMSYMQLEANHILLGYQPVYEAEEVEALLEEKGRDQLHLPPNFEPMYILKVGYPTTPIEDMEPLFVEPQSHTKGD